MSQPEQHQACHREINERFAGLRERFIRLKESRASVSTRCTHVRSAGRRATVHAALSAGKKHITPRP